MIRGYPIDFRRHTRDAWVAEKQEIAAWSEQQRIKSHKILAWVWLVVVRLGAVEAK